MTFPIVKTRPLAAVLALAGGLCSAAYAVPIDCSRAATRNERAICADPFLLQTDARLDTLYDISVRMSTPEARADLLTSQRAWVKEREACGTDKNCMRAAYARRASVFEAILKRVEARGPF